MYFYNFDIKTPIIPFKKYEFEKANIIIYPTNKVLEESRYAEPRTLTGFIIKGEKGELTNEYITEKIKDFLIFSNFIYPSHWGIEWFNMHFTKINDKDIMPIDELEDFLKKNYEEKTHENVYGYHFNETMYEINRNFAYLPKTDLKINFKEYYYKYLSLDETDILKKQLHLFALLTNSQQLLSPFYRNSNIEISLMISLIDSLIDDAGIEKNEIKKCSNCQAEYIGKKSFMKKAREFVERLNYNEDSKALIIKILKQHYKIRNNFYHDIKTEMSFEDRLKLNEIIKKNNNYLSLENELQFGEGRHIGLFTMREVIHIHLLQKLEKVNNN